MNNYIYTLPIDTNRDWYYLIENVASGETREFMESCFFTIWPYMNSPPNVFTLFVQNKLSSVIEETIIKYCYTIDRKILDYFVQSISAVFTWLVYDVYNKIKGTNLCFRGINETKLIKNIKAYHLVLG